MLKKIPILQPLIDSEDCQLGTLFDWVNKYDHQKDLEQMAVLCLQTIDRISEESIEEVKKRVEDDINSASRQELKEIRGLEERLSGLELIMAKVRTTNAEQQDCSNSLFKNQQRASNLRDNSVFPDLCRNHRSQLQLMLKNYELLRERRTTVANAKRELSNNLHQRLKWVMTVEKRMLETSERIMMFREMIRRHKLQMDVVRQIHWAPQLYVDAVVEVVRRRSFAALYLQWATTLSNDSSTVYEAEMLTRRSFTPKLISHFLSTLFPGIGDRPPAFALHPPSSFDQQLPNLNSEHIAILQDSVPELFSKTDSKSEKAGDATSLLKKILLTSTPLAAPETQSVAISCSTLPSNERRSIDPHKLLETIMNYSNCVAKVKDDLSSIRRKMINCKSEISESHSTLEKQIVHELSFIIEQFQSNKAIIEQNHNQKIEQLHSEITRMKEENRESQEREVTLKQVTEKVKNELESELVQVKGERDKMKLALVERECEFEDETKKALESKEKCIQSLSLRVTSLQDTVEELKEKIVVKEEEIEHLNKNLRKFGEEIATLIDNHAKEMENVKLKAEEEARRSLKEMKDRLTADHKNELESLRSRFKLAVSTSTIEKAQDSLSLDLQGPTREELLDENNALIKQLEQLKVDQETQLKQLKINHEVEITRLKQVQFNQSLNKLMNEKDDEIKQLKASVDQISRRNPVTDQSSQVPLTSASCADKVAVLR